MPTVVNKRKPLSEEHKNKIRLARIGKHHSKETKNKISKNNGMFNIKARQKVSNAQIGENNSMFGRHHTEEAKNKISIKNKGNVGGMSGKKHTKKAKQKISQSGIGRHYTEEAKNKMRISARQRVLGNGQFINIGKNEKQLLDLQERIDGVIILRSCYFHQIGYVVDGYCLETNTVYEVYEKYHSCQIKRDLQRKKEIQEHLNCNFVIIWDTN